MTLEVTVLALAALLQVVQFAIMAVFANLELGTSKTLGARDNIDLSSEVSVRTGRLIRALNNHFEALILFTIAVVVVTLGNQSSPVTETCAWAYLTARVLYVPAYAFGLSPWRSIVWAIGFIATLTMIVITLI